MRRAKADIEWLTQRFDADEAENMPDGHGTGAAILFISKDYMLNVIAYDGEIGQFRASHAGSKHAGPVPADRYLTMDPPAATAPYPGWWSDSVDQFAPACLGSPGPHRSPRLPIS